MYTHAHFAETDVSTLIELIHSAPLGALVVNGPHGLEANHIPFIHRYLESESGVLQAHIPRANPLSELLGSGAPCLAMFHGPDGYISPSWYATKKDHGRVVPTWNYSVVHVHGTGAVIDDPDWVLQQINALTELNEAPRPEPWSVTDAPEEFTQGLLKSLVGIEIAIERIEGKTKASQNQPAQNRESVLEALAKEQPDTQLTRLMREVLSANDNGTTT